MKIYHKKNFASGIAAVIAGIVSLLQLVRDGFNLYNLVWCGMFSYLACTAFERSLSHELSREDLINERDERNRLLRMKSNSLTLDITMYTAAIAGFILDFLDRDANGPMSHIALGLFLVWLFAFFVKSTTRRYYDKHL